MTNLAVPWKVANQRCAAFTGLPHDDQIIWLVLLYLFRNWLKIWSPLYLNPSFELLQHIQLIQFYPTKVPADSVLQLWPSRWTTSLLTHPVKHLHQAEGNRGDHYPDTNSFKISPVPSSPVEISQAKELSLLFLTDLLISFCEGFKVWFQHLLHRVILFIGADSLGTQLKFTCVWVSPGYHDTTIHLGRVQSPVRYTNEGHTLLSLNNLWWTEMNELKTQ